MPLGKEAGLGPGHIVSDGDPATPTAAPLHFRPMPIVAKWLPISATAEHLLYKSSAVAEMGNRFATIDKGRGSRKQACLHPCNKHAMVKLYVANYGAKATTPAQQA